jgi:hypothetical protein
MDKLHFNATYNHFDFGQNGQFVFVIGKLLAREDIIVLRCPGPAEGSLSKGACRPEPAEESLWNLYSSIENILLV